MRVLTPWFSASIKPVRKGQYMVGHDHAAPHRNSKMRLHGNFRYFDGKNWRAGWLNEIVSIFGNHPSHQWRGLEKKWSKP